MLRWCQATALRARGRASRPRRRGWHALHRRLCTCPRFMRPQLVPQLCRHMCSRRTGAMSAVVGRGRRRRGNFCPPAPLADAPSSRVLLRRCLRRTSRGWCLKGATGLNTPQWSERAQFPHESSSNSPSRPTRLPPGPCCPPLPCCTYLRPSRSTAVLSCPHTLELALEREGGWEGHWLRVWALRAFSPSPARRSLSSCSTVSAQRSPQSRALARGACAITCG